MGGFLVEFLGVPFMAENTPHLEMRIFVQQILVNNIPLVHIFRPNWRRRPGSPFAFTRRQGWRLMKRLHHGFTRMTRDAATGNGGETRPTAKQENKNDQDAFDLLLVSHKNLRKS